MPYRVIRHPVFGGRLVVHVPASREDRDYDREDPERGRDRKREKSLARAARRQLAEESAERNEAR